MIYFEDVGPGPAQAHGEERFTRAAIAQFARDYHLRLAAPDIASPWHVAAVWMKLAMANIYNSRTEDDRPATGVSPGFLDMRWPHSVRAGDLVRYSGRFYEKIELRSRKEFGIVRSLNEGHNQDGVLVYRFIGQALILRRP